MPPPQQPDEDGIRSVLRGIFKQLQAIVPRSPQELIDGCTKGLERLETSDAGCASLAIQDFLPPLGLACRASGWPKVVVFALESIHLLMTRGFLIAGENLVVAVNTKAAATPQPRDFVVDAACGCADNPDDAVQLQVLRVLLAAVTLPSYQVHGKVLMRSVSTCFKLHCDAASETVLRASHASLTQMVTTLVQRMEQAPALDGELSVQTAAPLPSSESSESHATPKSREPSDSGATQTIDGLAVTNGSHRKQLEEESARGALSLAQNQPSGEGNASGSAEDAGDVLHPCYRDALMVFLSLSKQCMKEMPVGTAQVRRGRSKQFSLELVFTILNFCGAVAKSSRHFFAIIKTVLCASLIHNTFLLVPAAVNCSLDIFNLLIVKFRCGIKSELGIFLDHVVLGLLDSGNALYMHRHTTLQLVCKICSDAPSVLEIFLNFDCDIEERNVLELLITCLSRIAQGRYTGAEHASLIDAQQEQELRLLSVQALSTLLGTVSDWARDAPLGRFAAQKAYGVDDNGLKQGPVSCNSAVVDADTPAPAVVAEQKHRKLELQTAVQKFNMTPKRGVEFLKRSGFVTQEPESLANFLQTTGIGLNKTAIGDYLGEDKPFNISVLAAILNSQDFKSMGIVDGLRTFLSIFRLPGEAQKVSRVLEKFAEKFASDNPEEFAGADCVFVLSFSLIMLQTDLNNPGVTKKMTKEGFIKNNRGINNGADFPPEYLIRLYEIIQSCPFSLNEDDDARLRAASQAAQSVAQKLELFGKEADGILNRSKQLLEQARQKRLPWTAVSNAEVVPPLFTVASWPMLAAFATVLLEGSQSAEQLRLVGPCVQGFRHGVSIAARFGMHTERDSFVFALARFTHLTALKELQPKNVECIRALLSVAVDERDYLGPSWRHVLRCISQLSRLQLAQMKTHQDFQFFKYSDTRSVDSTTPSSASTEADGALRRASAFTLMSVGSEDDQAELADSVSLLSQVDMEKFNLGAVDDVFAQSSKLDDGDAIVDFMTELAHVAREELAHPERPRIFSLQKAVEVAERNLGRSRDVWARLWRSMGPMFSSAARHPNTDLSVYAIDLLKQLSLMFLTKEGLGNTDFQLEFLAPFEALMTSSPPINRRVKEHIVSVVAFLIQGHGDAVGPGWRVLLHILRSVAQSSDSGNAEIAGISFTAVAHIVEKRPRQLLDHFNDGVATILAFAWSSTKPCEAVELLLRSVDRLAADDGATTPAVSAAPASAAQANSGNHQAERWLVALQGMSALLSSQDPEVRAAALAGVFGSLGRHGALLSPVTWRMVFNGVLKPLFDDVLCQLQPLGNSGLEVPDKSTSKSMGLAASRSSLAGLAQLFGAHLDALRGFLDDALQLIAAFIHQSDEDVARAGVEGYRDFLLLIQERLDQVAWRRIGEASCRLLGESNRAGDHAALQQFVGPVLFAEMLQDMLRQHGSCISPAGRSELDTTLQKGRSLVTSIREQLTAAGPAVADMPALAKLSRLCDGVLRSEV